MWQPFSPARIVPIPLVMLKENTPSNPHLTKAPSAKADLAKPRV